MEKLLYILGILGLLTVTSCNNDDPNEADEFITFGHYYGMCQGEDCLAYFRVTEKNLYEYPDSCLPTPISSCYDANPPKLSDDKFEIAKVLLETFPDELFDESEATLGCPDCGDQGGLFLEIYRNNDRQIWNIDQNKNSIPTYLHDYVDEINNVIQQIK